MKTPYFERLMNNLAHATVRRNALRSLGASGLALLAVRGHADASARGPGEGGAARVQAAGKRRKRRKKHGATGPAHFAFATRVEISASSNDLQAEAGSEVSVAADCGEAGKVVSCGYQMSGEPAEFVNAIVSTVEPNPERSGCNAFLLRTTDVGSTAGVTIQAVALCLV